MAHMTLIEDGSPVGYVDTETLEVEYEGDSDLAAQLLERLAGEIGIGMSPDDLYGEEVVLEGERAEEYVQEMAALDEVPFSIRRPDDE